MNHFIFVDPWGNDEIAVFAIHFCVSHALPFLPSLLSLPFLRGARYFEGFGD